MTAFKYRHDNSWRTPTVKRRENGQWVTLRTGDDAGDTPVVAEERFYTDNQGPPERAGDTINASNYSSLQAAADALTEGDILFIPAASGPYNERFEIRTDNTTIRSDGAWINQPDNNQNWAVRTGGAIHNNDTSLSDSHGYGDNEISVKDVSNFSPGDDIRIKEDRNPYGEPRSGGAGGAGSTAEYRTVESVDTDKETLTLSYPLMLPYPNTNSTEIGRVSWAVEDLHITGLNIRGTANETGSAESSRPFTMDGVARGWFEDMTVTQGGNHCVSLKYSYRCRFNNFACENALRYGINVHDGTTHTYATNISGYGLGRYVFRVGPSGGDECSSDVLVDGIYGAGMGGQFVANVHHGGFHVDCFNLEADGERVLRMRSRETLLDGFTGKENPSYDFRTRQQPYNNTVKNGDILSKPSGAGDVFSFDLRSSENERGENITFENIHIEPYDGRDITEIGYFNSNAIIDGLTFKNITYGEQDLKRSHVEAWRNYELATITDLLVE